MTNRQVAIVGYAFRLPGTTRENFWDALCAARDLVSTVDGDRWAKGAFYHPRSSEPGCSYTFAAGTLGDVSGFDAAFFGISPREAEQMDPQQRLLLELAWETFEHAGIKPSAMRGSRSGVYIGLSSVDYAYRRADDLASIDASTMTGNTASIAANRISYWFDLRGPSIAVDTACSSSLVAFHLACQSITSGECTHAVTGGISLHLHPFGFIGFSKASMLSKRGRCRVFDASGDGYVRSEGGGVFLLKNLRDALADGDRVFAVVGGSGTNCDGRTKGLTVPGAETQAALLADVYARAGIAPIDIDYLEAHGTGTAVGDPIEAEAIARALGQLRPASAPLLIGSVKSNLGHMEAASGVAGLVKSLHCLEHRSVPPSIQLEKLNPRIPFQQSNLKVVTEQTALPPSKKLVIGINSFGFGGANAHVILESGDSSALRAAVSTDRTTPLVLSARSESALKATAGAFAAHLRSIPGDAYPDIAYTAAFHRDWHEHRLIAFAENTHGIIRSLVSFAAGEPSDEWTVGAALPDASRPTFVYSGNGSQWAGMGRNLLEKDGVFAEAVRAVDAIFQEHGDYSIECELQNEENAERMNLTEVAQPTLFAVQVGLTAMLRAQGLTPGAVVGHSVGEVAAAWASGALTLEQAVRVVAIRSQAQGMTRGAGGMTAVGLRAEELAPLLEGMGETEPLAVAGFNSPRGVTLAGNINALARLERLLAEREVFFRRLGLDYAFHSPAMDTIAPTVKKALAELQPRTARTPFYSTVTGKLLSGSRLNAHYWWRNIREPVQFESAINALISRGNNVFVEVGPHAVLRNYISDCLKHSSRRGAIVPTMLRGDDRRERIQEAFFQTVIAGSPFDTHKLFPHKGRRVALPHYPWQRERHWHPTSPEAYQLIDRTIEHPLLGYRLHESEQHWENHLDTSAHPDFADHGVGNATVFPASGFVEMALAASTLTRPGQSHEVEELEILAPLLLTHDRSRTVRFCLEADDGSFTVKSRDRSSTEAWLTNVRGRLLGESHALTDTRVCALPSRDPDLAATAHYRLAGDVGLHYGPAFQTVNAVWLQGDSAWATLELATSAAGHGSEYHLHPAFLDGCFQLLVGLLHQQRSHHPLTAFIPTKIGRLTLHRPGERVAFAQARLVGRTPRSVRAEFALFGSDGRRVAGLEGVRFRAISLQPNSAAQLSRRLRFRAIPRPFTGAAPASPVLAEAASIARIKSLLHHESRSHDRSIYYSEVEPLLDVLCASYAERSLRGVAGDQTSFKTDELVHSGAVSAHHEPLLRRMVQVLQEDGIVEPTEEGWRWIPDSGLPPPENIWISLVGDYPDHASQLIPLGRIGLHLTEVLAGRVQPDTLVPDEWRQHAPFGPGHTAQADLVRCLDTLVRRTVEELAEGQTLRVLEWSAQPSRRSFGRLSGNDLDRCEYWLAGPVPADTEALVERSECGWAIRTCGLDLDHPDTIETTPIRHYFDLILIPEGLWQLQDAASALSQLRELLTPGGTLLFIEHHPSRTADLVFGLDPAWWSAAQRGAGHSHLRSPRQWKSLLESQGYGAGGAVSDAPGVDAGPFIVVARNPEQRPVVAESVPPGLWVILQDQSGYSSALAASLGSDLRGIGHRVVEVRPAAHFEDQADDSYALDPACQSQLEELFMTLRDRHGEVSGVVHLLDLSPDRVSVGASLERQQRRCLSVVQLLKACEAMAALPVCWFVTLRAAEHLLPDAARVLRDNQGLAVDDAALWGFTRTVMNEYPEMSLRLVDLADPDKLERMSAGLLQELIRQDSEDEVVLTGEGRYATRLDRSVDPSVPRAGSDSLPPPSLRLDFAHAGQLKSLDWHPHDARTPADDEIAIEVRAAGLNFRDVMYAMGLLSDEAVEAGFAGPGLGMELSGIVREIGPAVEGLQPGDPVIAFAPSSFSNRVVTKASAAVVKPAAWSFEAAATVPIAFFTVYYALVHLARLREGEKVLIHGAAGGVGIAAIQLAKVLGAEIFATAGSDEKRDFVKLLGADHVCDSRSLGFADEVLQMTGGHGIDVVLNSLAGEAINRNLKILKPFGRFLELGKRDFYENTKIGLHPFRNNIAYFGIDADQLMIERPELTRQLFLELMDLFRQGALKPLPYRAFPAAEAVEAFRHMLQSRHTGKIVLRLDEPIEHWVASSRPSDAFELKGPGTYLVTGGLSGFGLEAARWLAAKGASHLFLIGRGGTVPDHSAALIAEMESMGTVVRTRSCDVTDRGALETLLMEAEQEGPPLRGILHAAAVFDDALARDMTLEQLHHVMAPKITGALNLRDLTRNRQLDFLVLFSSATTLFGNPGQAAYVAANHFLEALAEQLRAQGRRALCIGFGPIADAGYLARHAPIRQSLESRLGGTALTSAEALDDLEQALLTGTSNFGVMRFSWRTLSRLLATAQSPKFERLARTSGKEALDPENAGEVRRWLNELTDAEIVPLLLDALKKEMAEILKTSPDRLDENRSIHELGMDSLMGMELVTAVESRFAVKLPIMSLSEGPTIGRLADRILKQLRLGSDLAPEGTDAIAHVVAQYADELSPDRVDTLRDGVAERLRSPRENRI